MNFSPDTNDLRGRYRQSSRSFAHSPVRTQQTIQSRPHAVKRKDTTQIASDRQQKTAATPSDMFAMATNGYKTASRSIERRETTEKQTVQQEKLVHVTDHKEKKVEQTDKRIETHKEVPTIWRPTESKKGKRLSLPVPGDRKMRKPQAVLLAVVGFVLMFGITLGLMDWRTDPYVEAQAMHAEEQVRESSVSAAVDETDITPEALVSHTVSADHPKRITIAKAKIDSRVFGAGLKDGNQLDPPKNVFDVSWYDKSAKPGSGSGAVLLNGYERGIQKNGALYSLNTLVQGDQIIIERGDGQHITYEVVQTQSYPKNDIDMTAVMLPVENGEEGLNIVTSHGEFDSASDRDHFVIFAVRIS